MMDSVQVPFPQGSRSLVEPDAPWLSFAHRSATEERPGAGTGCMSNKEQMWKCADEMLVSHTAWIFQGHVNVLSPMLTLNSTPHSAHVGEFV